MKLIIQNERIAATATDEYTGPEVFIEAPADFDILHLSDYRVIAGVLTLQDPVLIATKYKLRLALLQEGLLDEVEAFVATTDDRTVKIAWQYADEYRTDDPLVIGMGVVLHKTSADIWSLFTLAMTL